MAQVTPVESIQPKREYGGSMTDKYGNVFPTGKGDYTGGDCCCCLPCLPCCRCADPLALQPQPGSCCMLCGGMGICSHKGTDDYPAYPGMLNANRVAGVYQDPNCKPLTVLVRPIPCIGTACVTWFFGPCPISCVPAPFNCLCALGSGGTPLNAFYLPTAKCLPGCCTLAATWFCFGPICFDFHSEDVLLTSICFSCPVVYRKTKQTTQILPGGTCICDPGCLKRPAGKDKRQWPADP